MFGLGDNGRATTELLQRQITTLEHRIRSLQEETERKLNRKFYHGMFIGALTFAIIMLVFK